MKKTFMIWEFQIPSTKRQEKGAYYLREAAPVLEQFYGSEYPKVIDAKKRLKQEETKNESIGV